MNLSEKKDPMLYCQNINELVGIQYRFLREDWSKIEQDIQRWSEIVWHHKLTDAEINHIYILARTLYVPNN